MQYSKYYEQHKNEIFKKYDDKELIKDVNSFVYGNGNLNKVLNHFFEECIFECCGKKTKISPMDCIKNDELVEKIIEYTRSKPNFFKGDEISNIKSCIRNSLSWVRKVANFPPKTARDIYRRYFNRGGLHCLDTSAGFGSRMSAVLLSKNNYYGIDPNKKLYNKLLEYESWLSKYGFISEEQECKLYNCGSEVLIPELVDKIDVVFTSPPYFNLEKYSDDDYSSSKNYNDYDRWVQEFVVPTVRNIYSYLKVGGYAMINIKNISKKQKCFDDFYDAFNSIDGFKFVEIFDIKIKKKQYGMADEDGKGDIKNQEPVMAFKKIA